MHRQVNSYGSRFKVHGSTVDELGKTEIQQNLSFRRKPESSYFKIFWTSAFAGVTTQKTFYDPITVGNALKSVDRFNR
jgi:hypothetical protein